MLSFCLYNIKYWDFEFLRYLVKSSFLLFFASNKCEREIYLNIGFVNNIIYNNII